MTITLPLPAELTSTFVVAVERTPAALETIAPWRVAAPYRRAALEAYGTPALRVTRQRSQWKPIGVTLGEEDRRLLRRTRHHLLVTTTCSPYELPHNLQVARATARALAKEYSGLVIDPIAGTPVLSCDRCVGEPADFRLADDWLGWDVQVHDDATCPPWDPAGTGSCACLRVTSRGLSRFALPEITLDGAACAHNLCAMNLLRIVATRLLTDHLTFLTTHPTATERTINDHLRIDQAFFPGGPPFNVHLTPYAPQPLIPSHLSSPPPPPSTPTPSPLAISPPAPAPRVATAPEAPAVPPTVITPSMPTPCVTTTDLDVPAVSPAPASRVATAPEAPAVPPTVITPSMPTPCVTTIDLDVPAVSPAPASRVATVPEASAVPPTVITPSMPTPCVTTTDLDVPAVSTVPALTSGAVTPQAKRGSHLKVAPPSRPEPITHLKVGPASGPGQVTCLKVGPPSDFSGSLNDWLCATQSPAPALAA